MLSILRERLRQGHRTISLSQGECLNCPTGSVVCRFSMRRSAPRAAKSAPRRVRPTPISCNDRSMQIDMGRCLFCTECARPARRARSRTARNSAWRPDRATTWSSTATRLQLARAARRQNAAAVRPVAQAAVRSAPAAAMPARPTSTC